MTKPFDEVRRIADELELKIHLAKLEVRDRWTALKPRIAELERIVERTGEQAGHAIDAQVDKLAAALRSLRDDASQDHSAR